MSDHCDLFHHWCREWNTLADELTHRERETGSSWGSHEGRPAAIIIFFDGGVDGVGGSRNNHNFPAGAGCSTQTPDETGQDPKWQTRLQVCCAVSQATTVTQAVMRAAIEAVKAVVSSVKHGKVMFNLDGQVLENPLNPFKRTRSRDTGQRES